MHSPLVLVSRCLLRAHPVVFDDSLACGAVITASVCSVVKNVVT